MRFAKPKPKDLRFYEHVWPNVQGKFTGEFEILRALLEEQAKAAAADEPPLPVLCERFLTQPYHARWLSGGKRPAAAGGLDLFATPSGMAAICARTKPLAR